MKICVYAICKNEEKHIRRWYECIKEADDIVVMDTGCTDNSVLLLRELGVTVHEGVVSPWRFDLARNMSLHFVPENVDVCLSLDLDEVMLPGWRQGIEKAWKDGVTEIRYPYVFNWDDIECTIPRITMYNFKIHARHGYTWHYPVHEIVSADDPKKEKMVICEEIICYHYADPTKERNYQILLDKACEEYPNEERFSHQRGRELMMYERYEEAITEFIRHLGLTAGYNTLSQVRSLTYRYIGRCQKALNKSPEEVLNSMLQSVSEYPYQREPWIWLAQAWMDILNYPQAYACVQTGLRFNDRSSSFESEEGCWGEIPLKISEIALSKMKVG